MTADQTGPRGLRRGRGARERLLTAAGRLFAEQGINPTGMDALCAAAQVSKRTAYQHFGSKDDLIAAHLRAHDPETMPEVFERDDLSPREKLLAAFAPAHDGLVPLCPFLTASVELADAAHPARLRAREYKQAVAGRFAKVARDAGASDPETLGDQLALLLDGASVRTRALGVDTQPVAAGIAAALIDAALPS